MKYFHIGHHYIASFRRGPQLSYGRGSYHHDPNAMDMDHLMLFLVELLTTCAKITASYILQIFGNLHLFSLFYPSYHSNPYGTWSSTIKGSLQRFGKVHRWQCFKHCLLRLSSTTFFLSISSFILDLFMFTSAWLYFLPLYIIMLIPFHHSYLLSQTLPPWLHSPYVQFHSFQFSFLLCLYQP